MGEGKHVLLVCLSEPTNPKTHLGVVRAAVEGVEHSAPALCLLEERDRVVARRSRVHVDGEAHLCCV